MKKLKQWFEKLLLYLFKKLEMSNNIYAILIPYDKELTICLGFNVVCSVKFENGQVDELTLHINTKYIFLSLLIDKTLQTVHVSDVRKQNIITTISGILME